MSSCEPGRRRRELRLERLTENLQSGRLHLTNSASSRRRWFIA